MAGKGRRAADRRREREHAQGPVDPLAKTKEVTSVGGPDFDARAETVLSQGHLQRPDPRTPAGLEQGELGEDTARLNRMSEVTAIRPPPDKPTLHGGRLIVRKGPDAGLDVVVRATPTMLGRAHDADVRLGDPKVSRKHLELRYVVEDRAFIVSDLGSKSGTLLAGLPIEMPTEIKHGDLLHVGESELRFYWNELIPEEKPAPPPPKERTITNFLFRPAEEQREKTKTRTKTLKGDPAVAASAHRRRTTSLVLSLIAVILLAGLGTVGYFVFLHGRADAGQVQAQLATLLADAKRLFDEGRLVEARARLDAALALAPGDGTAASLMRLIDTDLEAEKALAEARRLFDEGKVEEALKALLFIPDASRFAKGRDELKREADERARKGSLRVIEGKIDGGDLDDAARLLEEHLARWPSDAFASAMKERIHKIRNAPPPENPAIARARDAFQRGEAMEARVLAEQEAQQGAVVAQRYLADLDAFEAALDEGRALLAKKEKGAVRPLEKAAASLARLGRRAEGPLALPVHKALADALYLSAVSARQNGDDCQWAAAVHRARALAPKDAKLAAQARDVDQEAKAAITRARARASADPDAARSIAAAALCLVERGTSEQRALKDLAR